MCIRDSYYSDGLNKLGPFTLEELRLKALSPDSKIWYDGMTDWKRADQIDELKSLFSSGLSSAPPLTSSGANSNVLDSTANQYPPKTWLVESILATIFCCLPFGIPGIIFASKVESHFYAGRHQEAEKASRDARKWTLISFWVGFAAIAIYMAFMIIGIVFAAAAN